MQRPVPKDDFTDKVLTTNRDIEPARVAAPITIITHNEKFVFTQFPGFVLTTYTGTWLVDIRFVNQITIYVNSCITYLDSIAGNANNAFDVVLRRITREMKNHKIALLGLSHQITQAAYNQIVILVERGLHTWPLDDKAHRNQIDQCIDCDDRKGKFEEFPKKA